MSWQMILAPFGVIFIVLLTWLWGGLKRPPTLDVDSAMNRFSLDYPDCMPVSCDLSADGNSALLEMEGGQLGIVTPHGTQYTTRLWKKGDIADVTQHDATVTVATGDFKIPPINIRLADTANAKKWAASLATLEGKAA